ncbi:hypothetical protein AAHC03_013393 [Spirometra sp. Aus1]
MQTLRLPAPVFNSSSVDRRSHHSHPHHHDSVYCQAHSHSASTSSPRHEDGPLTSRISIHRLLTDLLSTHPRLLLFLILIRRSASISTDSATSPASPTVSLILTPPSPPPLLLLPTSSLTSSLHPPPSPPPAAALPVAALLTAALNQQLPDHPHTRSSASRFLLPPPSHSSSHSSSPPPPPPPSPPHKLLSPPPQPPPCRHCISSHNLTPSALSPHSPLLTFASASFGTSSTLSSPAPPSSSPTTPSSSPTPPAATSKIHSASSPSCTANADPIKFPATADSPSHTTPIISLDLLIKPSPSASSSLLSSSIDLSHSSTTEYPSSSSPTFTHISFSSTPANSSMQTLRLPAPVFNSSSVDRMISPLTSTPPRLCLLPSPLALCSTSSPRHEDGPLTSRISSIVFSPTSSPLILASFSSSYSSAAPPSISTDSATSPASPTVSPDLDAAIASATAAPANFLSDIVASSSPFTSSCCCSSSCRTFDCSPEPTASRPSTHAIVCFAIPSSSTFPLLFSLFVSASASASVSSASTALSSSAAAAVAATASPPTT